MLKQLGLAALMLFGLASSVNAQERIYIYRNGQVVATVIVPRQTRCEPRHRVETPRCERRSRHRVLVPITPRCGRYDPVIHVFRPHKHCR